MRRIALPVSASRDSVPPLCPSAQPDMAEAAVFGVVLGTALEPAVALTAPELAVLRASGPLKSTQYLRIAARCEEGRCLHFDGTRCQLASRVATRLKKVVSALPKCSIRTDCRWFQQEGPGICFRCPQVITESSTPSQELAQVAMPTEANRA
jgi:hypothetical protein